MLFRSLPPSLPLPLTAAESGSPLLRALPLTLGPSFRRSLRVSSAGSRPPSRHPHSPELYLSSPRRRRQSLLRFAESVARSLRAVVLQLICTGLGLLHVVFPLPRALPTAAGDPSRLPGPLSVSLTRLTLGFRCGPWALPPPPLIGAILVETV